MGRQNKKASVAALHKENILHAAERLFIQKGFSATTIDDISKAAEYSRRTVYAYFGSKEEILYHIVLKGLAFLKEKLTDAVKSDEDFLKQYQAICKAMAAYHATSPLSFESVNQMRNKNMNLQEMPQVVFDIFAIGEEINRLLEQYIETGIKQNVVRANVKVKQTVYVLWSSISSLLSLAQNKGLYIEKAANTTLEEFLNYGFTQIINSILEERI